MKDGAAAVIDDERERRVVRLRHGIAPPLDVVLSPDEAEALAECSTVGQALELILAKPSLDPRFVANVRKTIAGPSVVVFEGRSGSEVANPRSRVDRRLVELPFEVGVSKAVRGGRR
jgi:hypothetical protein